MTVPRCANPDCEDPYGGRVFPACLRPGRITGRRFGIEGVLCIACYGRYARGSDLREGRRRRDRPPPVRPELPAEAVRTIAALRAQAEQLQAEAEPRRPCTANAKGGHRLVQPPGSGPHAPFVCADCGWRFVPPDAYLLRRRSA